MNSVRRNKDNKWLGAKKDSYQVLFSQQSPGCLQATSPSPSGLAPASAPWALLLLMALFPPLLPSSSLDSFLSSCHWALLLPALLVPWLPASASGHMLALGRSLLKVLAGNSSLLPMGMQVGACATGCFTSSHLSSGRDKEESGENPGISISLHWCSTFW